MEREDAFMSDANLPKCASGKTFGPTRRSRQGSLAIAGLVLGLSACTVPGYIDAGSNPRRANILDAQTLSSMLIASRVVERVRPSLTTSPSYEFYCAGGRYRSLSHRGATSNGTYAIRGDTVCITSESSLTPLCRRYRIDGAGQLSRSPADGDVQNSRFTTIDLSPAQCGEEQ